MPLAADMSAFVVKARARLQQAPRAVLSAVVADLVQATPVDTGALRGAWQAAAGLTAPGGDGTLDPSGDATIERLQGVAKALQIGDTFTVLNDMPYGPFLEYGTATIAPRAFVRGTIARAPALAARVIGQGGTNAKP